jgi:hypothetical protein
MMAFSRQTGRATDSRWKVTLSSMNQDKPGGDGGAVAGGLFAFDFLTLGFTFLPQTIQLSLHSRDQRFSTLDRMAVLNQFNCGSTPGLKPLHAMELDLFAVLVLPLGIGQESVECRIGIKFQLTRTLSKNRQ